MGWLFDNPIAGMWGPYFLGFYALIFGVLFGFCWWHRGRKDSSADRPPLPVPARPDPYQLAYLRGGVNEVLRLATVDLYQRGLLGEIKSGWFSAKRLQLEPETDTGELPPIVRTVARYYRQPRKPDEIFGAELRIALGDELKHWDDWIESEELQFSEMARSAQGTLVAFISVAFASLGLYKLVAALLAGRENIWFLVVAMAAGSIVMARLAQLPRFTRRGRRYIENLQTAFADLKRPAWHQNTGTAADETRSLGQYALPVMAMGVFGVAALQGGPLDAMYHHYVQSAATGSSCGGGCGGGAGGAGGCGGCGGCGG